VEALNRLTVNTFVDKQADASPQDMAGLMAALALVRCCSSFNQVRCGHLVTCTGQLWPRLAFSVKVLRDFATQFGLDPKLSLSVGRSASLRLILGAELRVHILV